MCPRYPAEPAFYAVDGICLRSYITMGWDVEFTDEFGAWWETGAPPFVGSRHGHLRELRVQHRGEPYRILYVYALDPRRTAIPLVGGMKTGADRWYDEFVPLADRLYDEHLNGLRREGFVDGSQV